MEMNYEKRGYLLEDFRLFHLRDSQGTTVDYHYHEFYKLLLLISGSGSYAVEGRHYQLKPGDAVLLKPHCVHRPEFEVGTPYERVILYIAPGFLQRESAEDCNLEACFDGSKGPILRFSDRRRAKLLLLAEELEQELSMDRFGRAIAGNSLLLRLLVEIGRYQQLGDTAWPEPVMPRSGTMEQILRYLEENLTKEISLDEVAEACYLSKYHMMRRFRQETGTTVHTYLTERRLFLAKELMAQGMASTEACYAVGFGTYSSFSRAFQKLFGTTPTGRALQHRNRVEPID